jgi:hypothetical protein
LGIPVGLLLQVQVVAMIIMRKSKNYVAVNVSKTGMPATVAQLRNDVATPPGKAIICGPGHEGDDVDIPRVYFIGNETAIYPLVVYWSEIF